MYIKSSDERIIMVAESITLFGNSDPWIIKVNGVQFGSYSFSKAEKVIDEIYEAIEAGRRVYAMPKE